MKKRHKVVGAGFSGLSLAYYLVKGGQEVEVLEQNPDVGGLLHTLEHPLGLVETAANGILWTPALQRMCDEIGVELLETEKTSRRRYIFSRSKLRRWPLQFGESVFFLGKLLVSFFRPSFRKPKAFETVSEYISRVLSRAALTHLVAPGLQGVYAGDVSRMSATLLLGKILSSPAKDIHDLLYKKEKYKRRGTVAPRGGMGQLLEKLKIFLVESGVEFSFSKAANDLALHSDNPIIWATSAWSAAAGLKNIAPEASRSLQKIEMLDLVTATLFFEPPLKPIKGFGVLFRRGEGVKALGVLFNNYIFKNRSLKHSETWIVGGAFQPGVSGFSDEELLELLLQDRKKLYPDGDSILGYQITRWPKALPHYTIELEKILRALVLPKALYLHGNYLGRIGLSQILERSRALAEKISSENHIS